MDQRNLLTIYRVMHAARQIDKISQELTQRGEAFTIFPAPDMKLRSLSCRT